MSGRKFWEGSGWIFWRDEAVSWLIVVRSSHSNVDFEICVENTTWDRTIQLKIWHPNYLLYFEIFVKNKGPWNYCDAFGYNCYRAGAGPEIGIRVFIACKRKKINSQSTFYKVCVLCNRCILITYVYIFNKHNSSWRMLSVKISCFAPSSITILWSERSSLTRSNSCIMKLYLKWAIKFDLVKSCIMKLT